MIAAWPIRSRSAPYRGSWTVRRLKVETMLLTFFTVLSSCSLILASGQAEAWFVGPPPRRAPSAPMRRAVARGSGCRSKRPTCYNPQACAAHHAPKVWMRFASNICQGRQGREAEASTRAARGSSLNRNATKTDQRMLQRNECSFRRPCDGRPKSGGDKARQKQLAVSRRKSCSLCRMPKSHAAPQHPKVCTPPQGG